MLSIVTRQSLRGTSPSSSLPGSSLSSSSFRNVYNTAWGIRLTLCMLGNFFKYLFLSKISKNSLFPPIFFADIYNLNVKQFGSQMKPHILWSFIWIQIVCKGHQRSSKFTASGLRVKATSILTNTSSSSKTRGPVGHHLNILLARGMAT